MPLSSRRHLAGSPAAHTQPLSLSLVTPPSQPSSSAAALATACVYNAICVCDTCASSHHSGDDSARTVVFDADNSNGRNCRPPNALNAYIDRKRTWSASFQCEFHDENEKSAHALRCSRIHPAGSVDVAGRG